MGCGRKILKDYVNLDIFEAKGVDIVRDVTKGLPFEDNSFEEVLCEDFLEHIPQEKVIFVMNEIWRVMKNKAIFKIHVPESPGVTAFQDPTHLSYWNEESFTYYLKNHRRREGYGVYYGIKAAFKLKSLSRKDHMLKKYEKIGLPNFTIDVELIAIK